MNIYSSLFTAEATAASLKSILEETDPSRKVYLMLITGRCGSTFLCQRIENLSLTLPPHEFLNPGFIQNFAGSDVPLPVSTYFSRLFAGFDSNLGFGIQIDPGRLKQVGTYINLKQDVVDSGIPLIIIKRHDILAQAISFEIAKMTSKWHNVQYSSRRPNPIPSLNKVFEQMIRILKVEQYLHEISSPRHEIPLFLWYETIIDSTAETLKALTEYLNGFGFGISKEDFTAAAQQKSDITKNSYVGIDELVDQFKRKYMSELDEIQKCRSSNHIDKFLREYSA